VPKDLIPHVKKSFHITWGAEMVSCLIMRTAQELEVIHRRGPTGVASAVWYIASVLAGKKVPLEKIAEAAEVPEETIRNRCDDLVNHLLFIITL
jgi:transcription initiation factor TFIIIB Brf1 subunit/transcription initiation factor TFIIB